MDVAVIGAGYVGAVTATCLASIGHDVNLVETAPERLRTLRAGHVPFFEPGLDERFGQMVTAGRLRIWGDAAGASAGREAVLVCVGTPLSEDGQADLSQVESVCRAIASLASDTIVVLRSTMPLGTTPGVAEWLGLGSLASVVTTPEFLRQGTAVSDFLNPTRIVFGTEDGLSSIASDTAERLYAGIEAPRLVTDSAEMIKNVSNGFLATKLSFINEVADLCEAYDADVEAVIRGIGFDPRIGASYLRPGIGFGGSCLPKELANLVRLGRNRGLPMRMLGAAGEANDERSQVVIDRLSGLLGSFDGRRVALLGLAFKPDTDDTRYSPALGIARELISRGAMVVAHDPAVPLAATHRIVGLERAATPDDACAGADLVILATEWQAYRQLDWASIAKGVRSRVLFDGRNALDAEDLRQMGWWVIGIGTAVKQTSVAALRT